MPSLFGTGIILLLLSTQYSINKMEAWQPDTFSFRQAESVWIDSLLANMTLKEKVSQLILQKVSFPHQEDDNIVKQARSMSIGGVVFDGYPKELQFELAQLLQNEEKIPFLIGMKGMIDESKSLQFPNLLSLKAVRDSYLLEKYGASLAHFNQQLGVHLFFPPEEHPSLDFLPEYLNVLESSLQKGIITCSYINPSVGLCKLPLKRQADSTAALRELILGEMPALYIDPSYLASITDNTVKIVIDSSHYQFFHNQLKYEGLLITSLIGDFEQLAPQISQWMQMGGDMMMLDDHIYEARETLIGLIKAKVLKESQINEKVRKVLQAKYWTTVPMLLEEEKNVEIRKTELQSQVKLNREMALASLTLVKDEYDLVPLKELESAPFCLAILGKQLPVFEKYVNYYASFNTKYIKEDIKRRLPSFDSATYAQYGKIIVALNSVPWDDLEEGNFWQSLAELSTSKEVIIVNFGQLHNLNKLEGFPAVFQTYSTSSEIQSLAAQALFGGVEIHGKLPVNVGNTLLAGMGEETDETRLAYSSPNLVSIDHNRLTKIDSIVVEGIREQAMPGCQVLVAKSGHVVFQKAYGYHTYDSLQKVQNSDLYDLASITKVAATTLASMKLAEEGDLIVDKKLGFYFRDTNLNFEENSKFEIEYKIDTIKYEDYFVAEYSQLASGDNIWEEGKEEDPLKEDKEEKEEDMMKVRAERYQDSLMIVYHPKLRHISSEDNILHVSVKDLLTHHSGVPLDMPLYPFIHNRNRPKKRYQDFYKPEASEEYSVAVADHMYLKTAYRDSICKNLMHSKLYVDKSYEYSDLNMILLQWVIDSLTSQTLDEYLSNTFYNSLGLQNLQFNPWKEISEERLIPTQKDNNWRRQLLKGYVHDPAAALLGGVAGNAGLFSNANDLAILFQMLLNGGTYGGQNYLDTETIQEFTSRHIGHRGLGFDKPPTHGRYIIGASASKNSFGHTGFTGTCVWVDPEHELIFIFLSNRLFPDEDNAKLNELRIRSRIHEVVYGAMTESETNSI